MKIIPKYLSNLTELKRYPRTVGFREAFEAFYTILSLKKKITFVDSLTNFLYHHLQIHIPLDISEDLNVNSQCNHDRNDIITK